MSRQGVYGPLKRHDVLYIDPVAEYRRIGFDSRCTGASGAGGMQTIILIGRRLLSGIRLDHERAGRAKRLSV
jgi:hypothetical protein